MGLLFAALGYGLAVATGWILHECYSHWSETSRRIRKSRQVVDDCCTQLRETAGHSDRLVSTSEDSLPAVVASRSRPRHG